jgi:esterase/lipase
MGMISHLIPPDEDKPSYKLEGVIESISQLVAQSVADSATPEFKRLLQAVNDNGGRSDNSITKATNALKQAIQSEIRSLKPEIKKLADAIQSTNESVQGLQDNLVDALSKVKIPDHSDRLDRLERLITEFLDKAA